MRRLATTGPSTSPATGTARAERGGGPLRRQLLRVRPAQPRRIAFEVRTRPGKLRRRGLRRARALPELGRHGARRHRRADAGRSRGMGGMARRPPRSNGPPGGELPPPDETGRTGANSRKGRKSPPHPGVRHGVRGKPPRPQPSSRRHRNPDGSKNGNRLNPSPRLVSPSPVVGLPPILSPPLKGLSSFPLPPCKAFPTSHSRRAGEGQGEG